MNKASQTIAQKQNYVTTTSDRIVIVSVIFLMITQIFQYIETQVSKKALKLLWNTLPNLIKKSYVKFCHKEKNYLHTLKNASKIFLHQREIMYGSVDVVFGHFRQIKFWIFLEKKTHISKGKISVRHWVPVQRKHYHKFGTYPKKLLLIALDWEWRYIRQRLNAKLFWWNSVCTSTKWRKIVFI